MTTWQPRREDILAAVDAVDAGDGVVILTDMFGGTPSNLAISVMQNRGVEVIAGVNLPMLVKLARVRGDLRSRQAVRIAAEAGRKYINVANESSTASRCRAYLSCHGTTAANPGRALAQQLTIVNRKGLHARASARFVRTAECFDAEITVMRDGRPSTAIRSWA